MIPKSVTIYILQHKYHEGWSDYDTFDDSADGRHALEVVVKNGLGTKATWRVVRRVETDVTKEVLA
jgi:hypothetical protein